MTGRWDDENVRVRRLRSGALRIGPYSTSAAGVARLNLPGATMLVDPLVPHCIPTLEVSDASEAVGVIRALYGSAVARHVLDVEPDSQATADVECVLGLELYDLNRLGQLIWLSRSAPWPMPSTVLVAELIVAVDTCLVVLEDPGDVPSHQPAPAGDRCRSSAAAGHDRGGHGVRRKPWWPSRRDRTAP